MNEFPNHLAQLVECQEKQDPGITHEWLIDSRAESVRLANYLRQNGYQVQHWKARVAGAEMFYVGVKFESIKKSV